MTPATPTTIRMPHPSTRVLPLAYAAPTAHILTELLQNARRAGADHVTIELLKPPPGVFGTVLSVTDDGHGIAHPQDLFPGTGGAWPNPEVQAEHPEGLGLYSLSDRGCTVTSRPRPDRGQPWQTTLEPEHFHGRHKPPVHYLDECPDPTGTTVVFPALEHAGLFDALIPDAARHTPLNVELIIPGSKPRTFRPVPFLPDSGYHTRKGGVTFHVQTGTPLHQASGSLAGRLVYNRLPALTDLNGQTWYASFESGSHPDFLLAWPNRTCLPPSPAYYALWDNARLAILEAMAAGPTPRPEYADWETARRNGIRMKQPAPRLVPFTPPALSHSRATLAPPAEDAPRGSLVIHPGAHTPLILQHQLALALRHDPQAPKAYHPSSRQRGFRAYGALTHVHGLKTIIHIGSDSHDANDAGTHRRLEALLQPGSRFIDVDDITIEAVKASGRGPGLAIRAPLAIVPAPQDPTPDNAIYALTPDPGISETELTVLLEDLYLKLPAAGHPHTDRPLIAAFRQRARALVQPLFRPVAHGNQERLKGLFNAYITPYVPSNSVLSLTLRDGILDLTLTPDPPTEHRLDP